MLNEITQRNASKSIHVFNKKMQARVFCVGKSTKARHKLKSARFFFKKETNFFARIAMSQFGQHFF